AQTGWPGLPRRRVARGRAPRLPHRAQGRARRRLLARTEPVQWRDVRGADPCRSEKLGELSIAECGMRIAECGFYCGLDCGLRIDCGLIADWVSAIRIRNPRSAIHRPSHDPPAAWTA